MGFALETLGVTPPLLTPFHLQSIGGGGDMANCASGVWPSINKGIFYPFRLYVPSLVTAGFIINGTSVSGKFDLGVYDEGGTRLVSVAGGNSANNVSQAGTSQAQVVDLTDMVIGPGVFYMALYFDNTTATLFRTGSFTAGTAADQIKLRALGVVEQASLSVLPATATFASLASAYVPAFGLLFDKRGTLV